MIWERFLDILKSGSKVCTAILYSVYHRDLLYLKGSLSSWPEKLSLHNMRNLRPFKSK